MKIKHINESGVKNPNPEIEEENNFYESLKKIPAPKKEFNLTADQRKWWYWFGHEFVSTRKFVQLDLIHLQNAAVSLDERNKILKKINKLNEEDPDGVAGWVQTFKNNTTNVTGYVTIYEKATKRLEEVSAHFGLSFSDRKKLTKKDSGVDPNQTNLFEEVLKKLHG